MSPLAPPPDDPVAPPPDDKDWTWVIDSACTECGFDPSSVDPRRVGDLLRSNTAAWEQILRADDEDVRRRPEPTIWSPLEYACHVRDVHRLYLRRLTMMLEQDGPHYPNWDQDETAVEQRYHEADPVTVSAELRAAADALADAFDAIDDDAWHRTGHRSDGAVFTVETFATYFIHDPIHHVVDAGRKPVS